MLQFKDRVKEAVQSYLESQKFSYDWSEKEEKFTLTFNQDGLPKVYVTCSISPEKNDPTECKIYTRSYSIHIPQEKRGEVTKFLMGINYNRIIQGFQMDLDDGEIVFESLLFCYYDIVPPMHLIERYFDVAVMEMQKALPKLMQIIYSNLSAEDAFNQPNE